MTPSSQTLRCGIIGMGPHGRRIAQAIASIPELSLTAVVDRSEQVLASLELASDVLRSASLSDVVSHARLDVLCIATNAPSHAEIAIQALQAGVKRVMVEKPMACSISETERMIAEAQRVGARLIVDHSRRHAPVYRWLRAQIRSGEWGQARSVWIQRPGIGLGCLGTHSFDLACFLIDQPVQAVAGWVDPPVGRNPRGEQFIDPGGTVVMDFGGGVRAIVAQIEDGAGPMSVEIDLTAARVRLDEKSGEIDVIERDLSIVPGPGRPAVFRPGQPPASLTAKTDMQQMTQAVLLELASDELAECAACHGQVSLEVLVAAYTSHDRGHISIALTDLTSADRQRWLPIT